jgi:flagellar protein FliL
MKVFLPIGIALLGVGVGLGAGFALKPAPEHEEAACEGEHCPEPAASEDAAHAAPKKDGHGGEAPEVEYVALDKPFIVPVFVDDRVAAMVVLSLSLEVPGGEREHTIALQPRLRDGFLAVMFRHANSGGFDGSFTAGQKMDDLKSALLATAKEVMAGIPVSEVLVTEIVRQDV